MASTLKSALPSHLKPSGLGNGDAEFAKKHHGKTQSHMVSSTFHIGSSTIYGRYGRRASQRHIAHFLELLARLRRGELLGLRSPLA